nr:hypothetical protein [Tanacetum cinerariifolium]
MGIRKAYDGINAGYGKIVNQQVNNNGADDDVGNDVLWIKNWVKIHGRNLDQNGGGGAENGGDNGGSGVLGNDQEIVDQELGDHNGGGGADDVQGVPVVGVGGGLVRGGDAVVSGVVDHDRPFILALPAPGHHVLPVDFGYDRPIVLAIPAQRGGPAMAVYGPMMHPGIGGGVLQPGGGGEIPIANATHANYFPCCRCEYFVAPKIIYKIWKDYTNLNTKVSSQVLISRVIVLKEL